MDFIKGERGAKIHTYVASRVLSGFSLRYAFVDYKILANDNCVILSFYDA